MSDSVCLCSACRGELNRLSARVDSLENRGDQDAREAIAGLQQRVRGRRTTEAEELLIACAIECNANARPYELVHTISHDVRQRLAEAARRLMAERAQS